MHNAGALVALGVMFASLRAANWLWPTRAERDRRELEAYPKTLISEGNGAIRVSGRIRCADGLLQAPLSGRPCVGYELVVETNVTSGAGPRGGATRLRRLLVDERDVRPFFLTDESGTARIDTSGPFRLGLRPDRTGVTRGDYPGEHRPLGQLLEAKGFIAVTTLGGWAPIRYGESVLAEDQLVSVGGPSDREVDPTGERSGPREPPVRLVLRRTEVHPLLIAAASTKP